MNVLSLMFNCSRLFGYLIVSFLQRIFGNLDFSCTVFNAHFHLGKFFANFPSEKNFEVENIQLHDYFQFHDYFQLQSS